jgi:hypothetical protein
MQNNYENLANAIVLQAVEDYKKILHSPQPESNNKKQRLEQFFFSDWFKMLTDIDPETLIKRLNNEVTP